MAGSGAAASGPRPWQRSLCVGHCTLAACTAKRAAALMLRSSRGRAGIWSLGKHLTHAAVLLHDRMLHHRTTSSISVSYHYYTRDAADQHQHPIHSADAFLPKASDKRA